ncbi:MAG: LLM class flavin-dependent oxidoreductase [Proteobacteria bacterium]|nr:LLM class flavin-dependent oxidoreductase [Pseudomonadota bacterium]HQR03171.1 LLM class flavin-dependent oxidoreductase [Rhodocyclaceae bacterium]
MLALSVLDVIPVTASDSPSQAVRRTVELARLAEQLGYRRYWFAEHHGMGSIASAATEVLIAHVAAATTTLRVGSGGVMLPNHAPLRIAEAYCTLEALHPGRIDLGLGRAPGSDPLASRALRAVDGGLFPELLGELLALTGQMEWPDGHWMRRVKSTPRDAALPPIWILGSSGASARLAGSAGMGYSFASHFSATDPAPAFEAYRQSFQPSANFPRPHTVLGVAVACGATQEIAEGQAASLGLAWVRIARGEFLPFPSAEEALSYPYTAEERQIADQRRAMTVVGTPDSVRRQLEARAAACGADEVMLTINVPDHAARLAAYEQVMMAFR